MRIDTNFNLKNYSALKLGPTKITALFLETKDDILSALSYCAENNRQPLLVGYSTNTIFTEAISEKYIIIFSELKNITQAQNIFTFESGLSWDKIVRHTLEQKFSGLESLSVIPSTVGAAPVQNIGAYGSEFADHCLSVEVFDLEQKNFFTIQKDECIFSYRNSLFKKNPQKYFIVSVTMELSDNFFPPIPPYKDVQKYFAEKNVNQPSAAEIREAIISIRNNKLPDTREIPNLGSYFQNPILSQDEAKKVFALFPEIPHSKNPTTEEVKFFAGWLIEQAGLKGTFDNQLHFGTYEKNALVLVGDGHGTAQELLKMEEKIISAVQQKFGIALVREPNLVQ